LNGYLACNEGLEWLIALSLVILYARTLVSRRAAADAAGNKLARQVADRSPMIGIRDPRGSGRKPNRACPFWRPVRVDMACLQIEERRFAGVCIGLFEQQIERVYAFDGSLLGV
jgi:hypothetical protein